MEALPVRGSRLRTLKTSASQELLQVAANDLAAVWAPVRKMKQWRKLGVQKGSVINSMDAAGIRSSGRSFGDVVPSTISLTNDIPLQIDRESVLSDVSHPQQTRRVSSDEIELQ